MEKVFKFYWDCGRQGDVESVFIATQEAVDSVIGKTVNFGEILGKHSEIYGELESKDFTELSSDPKAVELLREIFKHDTISGHNPLTTISEDEYDDE